MRAAWLEDQKLSYRTDLPEQSPQPGEALLRLRLAGVCATDLEMVKGYYPFTGIPGHEFVAEVVEVHPRSYSGRQPEESGWIGQRVVGEINAACGECETCRRGHPTHCERRTVLGIWKRNGVFAETVCLPIENLHRVPDDVSDDAAVFTEPLAAALEIQQQVLVQPDQRVLLIGAGRLGQLIAQALSLTGCDLAVVARHPLQRELLKRRGIRLVEADQLDAHRQDLVIEATGSQAGFDLALYAVRPRGSIVLKSTYHGNAEINLSQVVVNEITLVGSRCGPFEPALRLLASGQVDPTPLIERPYPLEQVLQAFHQAAQPGVLKVLITF